MNANQIQYILKCLERNNILLLLTLFQQLPNFQENICPNGLYNAAVKLTAM